jgi:hypothetical protein
LSFLIFFSAVKRPSVNPGEGGGVTATADDAAVCRERGVHSEYTTNYTLTII